MLRLVLVELNRLRWRRAVQLLVPVALIVPLALLALWTTNTDGTDHDALRKAEHRAALEAQQPDVQRMLRTCITQTAARSDLSDAQVREQCEERVLPRPEWFMETNQQQAHDAITDWGPGISILIAGVLALAAMTYAGADWASGSISNQLLFNPRRGALFLAKATAIGVLAAAVTLLAHLAWWAVFAMIAAARDLPWHGGWTGDAALLVAKSVAFSAIIATGAFALTMLLRHTVAALATTLVVGALSLIFIHGVDGTSSAQQLSPGLNTIAVFVDDVTYTTDDWSPSSEQRDFTEHRIGAGEAFGYWAVLWGLVGAGALVAFRRRDVP